MSSSTFLAKKNRSVIGQRRGWDPVRDVDCAARKAVWLKFRSGFCLRHPFQRARWGFPEDAGVVGGG